MQFGGVPPELYARWTRSCRRSGASTILNRLWSDIGLGAPAGWLMRRRDLVLLRATAAGGAAVPPGVLELSRGDAFLELAADLMETTGKPSSTYPTSPSRSRVRRRRRYKPIVLGTPQAPCGRSIGWSGMVPTGARAEHEALRRRDERGPC